MKEFLGKPAGILALTVLTALFSAPLGAQMLTQDQLDEWNTEIQGRMQEKVIEFANERLPEFVELKYLEKPDSNETSTALSYDWNSQKDWVDEISATADGLRFDGRGYNATAKGSYTFSDSYENTENSQLGIEYQWRRFPVYFNRLSEEDGLRIQQCVLESEGFEVTVDDCRTRLGFNPTQLSYSFFDIDFHAKMEGDQKFDQRNYVYGFEMNYSQNLGDQSFLLYPILTLGLEQVDPKHDTKRQAAFASNDTYDRAYAEFSATSGGFELFGQNLKFSYSWRYYRELSPEPAIESAGLDRFRYSAIALQVPTAILPWFSGEQNNFMITYASGSLPLVLDDEQTISIGWQTDIDFQSILGLN